MIVNHLIIDSEQLPEAERLCAMAVLENPSFRTLPGSSRPGKHHHYPGGLMVHTEEVWRIAYAMVQPSNYSRRPEINFQHLLLSCVFHDYGKCWDYIQREDGTIEISDHRHHVRHVVRSAIEWEKLALQHRVDQATINEVTHAILAHHGQISSGSPITPKTPLAHILHLADMTSARMSDLNDLNNDSIDHSKRV